MGKPRTSRRGRFVLAAVSALLLGLGLAACGGGDDKPEEIVTEDITDTGDDPFTDPVAPDPSDEVEQFAEEGAGDSEGGNKSAQDSVPDDGLTPQEVTGDQVGLYGGTLDQEECDRQQLIDFLSQDADKARAWTEVQGIEADQFANYINSLTPVLLTQDTMVVNHGYEDGDAYGYLAVLRRGTAVLVDELGVPRVKCYCGNPLLEPVIPQDFVYDPGEATTTTTSSTTTTTTAETTTTTAAVTTTTTPPTDFDVPRDPGDYLEQLCRFLGIINCPDPPEEEPEDLPGLINPGVNICALFPAGCELEDEDPWRDFDPGGLTTIRPSLGPLTQFQIQDIESGELVVRPLGAAGTDAGDDTTTTTACLPGDTTDPTADPCITATTVTTVPGGTIPTDTTVPTETLPPATEAPGG